TRMNMETILGALADGAQGVLMIVPLTAVAGIIIGSVALTGLGLNFGGLIKEAAGGSLWLLAIYTWIALYVAGMAIGETILYIVTAILIVPAFIAMGVPVLAAHMFIFWMAVAMFITPPNAPAVFVACAIADSEMWRTAYCAMKLGFVAFLLPFVFLINPALLWMGSAKQITLVMIRCLIGASFLAAAIQGYLLRKTVLWERLLLALGGLGLFMPSNATAFLGLFALIPLGTHIAHWRVSRRRTQMAA
ncbi:MAG: TRAP transporter large permease subunit, partial [Syntrophales bacterium LBB04]|nr:TRAP transporter large permease subunit [Syntrophales bacterium LBB04]